MLLCIFFIIKNISAFLDKNFLLIHEHLKNLIDRKSFSLIDINFQNIRFTNDKSNVLLNNSNITNVKDNGKIMIENNKTQIDLRDFPEVNTNYYSNASFLWMQIHETVYNTQDLKRIISGIHYSITMHIAKFYKEKNEIYLPSQAFYNLKKSNFYLRNLKFAYFCVLKGLLEYRNNTNYAKFLNEKEARIVKIFFASLPDNFYFEFNDLKNETNKNLIKKIYRLTNKITCEKCNLWSKIQFKGVYILQKIISDKSYINRIDKQEFIALLQLFFKLSESLIFVDEFESKLVKKNLF
ncbi:endoplasmic oxidoreductin-1 [Gurleya vavrai]